MGRAAALPLETDLREAAEERYLSYALSVITSRALPDVRDGLKPVQRRILYAMYQNLRLTAGARPRKSAAIVGEVLGKYHPHGDQAAYEAMVRMAQPFSLRYPLVHGEGNFGSLDGDNAAAYRYTEARLTALAEEMLADLGAETVPLRATFDAMLEEPTVLPSAIPQLLMNGSTGIAVGMATNIPPHNLSEVVAALTAMIDEPDLDVKGLLKHVKGPDFPTGGEILNTKKELREIYESGQGAVRLRGQYQLESLPRGKRQIVVTSIPYTVNKAELVLHIGEEILARKLPQVLDVRDESTADVRIVLELKADASPETAMAYLYKHTALQTNFNVNLTCLLPTANPAVGQPARVTLRDLCRQFLDFRLQVVTRRLEHEQRQLEARLHILDALARIYDDLDRAIRIIRKAESRADAARQLMAAFKLDQVQADAILDIRLYQLARLEIEKIRSERAEKKKRLKEIEALLARPRERWKMIRAELAALGAKYGDRRRTRVSRRRRSWSPPRTATASAPRPISPRRHVRGGAWRASARATRSCRSSRSPARRSWSPPGAARCSASRSTRWPSSPALAAASSSCARAKRAMTESSAPSRSRSRRASSRSRPKAPSAASTSVTCRRASAPARGRRW